MMFDKKHIRHLSFLLGTLIMLITASCEPKTTTDRVPVAKVMDKVLYIDQIKNIFPPKVSKEDSISMARAYIQTWIKTQLLVGKAELNLTPEQLNITEQIENYRNSLLIYKYEEQMIREKLDTIVKDEDIKKYFDENPNNFLLEEPIVKAVYLKFPKSSPDIDKVKSWYKSDQQEDIKKLDAYAYSHAVKYDYFKDDWVEFKIIDAQLPKAIEDEATFLKENKFIEQEDDEFYYFVYIKNYNLPGALSPFVFVQSKIKDIILNKRRIKFLSDLETQIYNDASDHSNFTIYDLDKK
jgi:hypothetical protein